MTFLSAEYRPRFRWSGTTLIPNGCAARRRQAQRRAPEVAPGPSLWPPGPAVRLACGGAGAESRGASGPAVRLACRGAGAALGYRLVRLTWRQVIQHPARIAPRIRRAFARARVRELSRGRGQSV